MNDEAREKVGTAEAGSRRGEAEAWETAMEPVRGGGRRGDGGELRRGGLIGWEAFFGWMAILGPWF